MLDSHHLYSEDFNLILILVRHLRVFLFFDTIQAYIPSNNLHN